MTSRDRRCGHLIPSSAPSMPMPTELLKLAPHMKILMAAAQEYDAIDPEPTTIVEWVRWLDVEVRQAVAGPYSGAIGVVQPLRRHHMTISR